jgi:hypothetical protein
MGGAVTIGGDPGQLGAFHGLSGGAARHRGGVDQAKVIGGGRDLRGESGRGGQDQRRGRPEAFVVAGLLGQVRKQASETAVAEAQPVVLGREPEQYLGNRETDQFSVAEAFRSAGPSPFGRDDMVIEEHIQCCQKGIEVSLHKQTSIPFPTPMSRPTDAHIH